MRCLFLWNKLLSISRISRFTGLLLKSGLPSTGAAPSVPEARDFQSWEVHTETTGLDSFHDEILQISIIDDTGKVLLDTLCKPYYHDSWRQAQSVNGIDGSMLQDAPYAHEIVPMVNAIIAQADTCIGYNIDFDIGFINQWGIATDHLYQIDVMRDFTDYYKAHEDPSYNRWHKLIQCAEYFGYEWEGEAHNSLADVKATLFCYQQMLVADSLHTSCDERGY